MTGSIFDIKEMAVHDGPGIRTTVFLKGCPLHCLWCHNPEGLTAAPQLMYKSVRCRHCGLCDIKCDHPECQPFLKCLHACPDNLLTVSGKTVSAEVLSVQLKKSAEPFGSAFGGFTFSGGEPLLQSDFLLETASFLTGYPLCIETSGYAKSDVFRKVLSVLDFVIMDLKIADTVLHEKYTGVGNEQILENFRFLKQSGKPYIIRTPLIPGITDTPENLQAIASLIGESKWEQLPYNALAGAKYAMLGMTYPLSAGTVG